jgi:pyruvate/2-oxoglutarate dehydrogenase complex dihydrolipoamide dehydrogenase (E3) component
MSNNQKYDLIVIGTGVAVSHAASKCSSAGWKVAIIDSLLNRLVLTSDVEHEFL